MTSVTFAKRDHYTLLYMVFCLEFSPHNVRGSPTANMGGGRQTARRAPWATSPPRRLSFSHLRSLGGDCCLLVAVGVSMLPERDVGNDSFTPPFGSEKHVLAPLYVTRKIYRSEKNVTPSYLSFFLTSTSDISMPTIRAHLRSSDSVDFEHSATMKDMEELKLAETVLAHSTDF
jgi:hypothetical protein